MNSNDDCGIHFALFWSRIKVYMIIYCIQNRRPKLPNKSCHCHCHYVKTGLRMFCIHISPFKFSHLQQRLYLFIFIYYFRNFMLLYIPVSSSSSESWLSLTSSVKFDGVVPSGFHATETNSVKRFYNELWALDIRAKLQSIVSWTSSLRDQLIKYFTTLHL